MLVARTRKGKSGHLDPCLSLSYFAWVSMHSKVWLQWSTELSKCRKGDGVEYLAYMRDGYQSRATPNYPCHSVERVLRSSVPGEVVGLVRVWIRGDTERASVQGRRNIKMNGDTR